MFHIPDIFNKVAIVLLPVYFEKNKDKNLCGMKVFIERY
jgi:hypothetical protein